MLAERYHDRYNRSGERVNVVRIYGSNHQRRRGRRVDLVNGAVETLRSRRRPRRRLQPADNICALTRSPRNKQTW